MLVNKAKTLQSIDITVAPIALKQSNDNSNLHNVIKRIMIKSDLRPGENLIYFS